MSDAISACGFSDEAEYVEKTAAGRRRALHQSSALGMESVLRDELAEVWQECSKPNWDGYGAVAVRERTYRNAERFLLALPLGTRAPSVGAEPDGQITFEWRHSRRRILSVSVSPEDELHYAALLGPSRTCGTEPFFGEVPRLIRELIGRVYDVESV
ncbi:MAG: hypothetical protein GYA33_15000 [Thermogutta sp.]|nr:hypothetical protein [Thermogutta sp.]